MNECFLAKSYPERVVNDQIEKAVFGKNPPVMKSKGSGIRFVATYHLEVKDLSEFVKDLLLLLYSEEEFETVFPPPLIVSSRSARKIKDYIVRSKLYSVERSVGKKCRLSRMWGLRCQVYEND